jgi:phosphate/sulfate permease
VAARACGPLQSFGAIGSTSDSTADAEGVAGISITLASLPGTEISVTHTLRSGIPDEGALGLRRCDECREDAQKGRHEEAQKLSTDCPW